MHNWRLELASTRLTEAIVLVGALLTASGLQEMVFQGVLNNRAYPLVGGTLGVVSGGLVLATGIALFRHSSDVMRLARGTASVCLPVFAWIGIIQPLAGRAATLLGLAVPILVLAVLRRDGHETRASGGSPRSA